MSLQKLSDQELISKVKNLVGDERKLLTEILRHLREIDTRRLYLARGYSSLFSFCVEFLGYEESQAQRRISACRLIQEIPELEKKVEMGTLSLTALTQAQSFFRQERETASAKKESAMTACEKIAVLEKLENKTTRQVERELVSLNPDFLPGKLESTKPLSETKSEIKIVIDNETLEKLNQLKDILAHRAAAGEAMTLAQVIDLLAREGLQKHNPMQAAKRPQKSPSAPKVKSSFASKPARHIPNSIRRSVWHRDQGECTFMDPLTGKICQSRYKIQIDHIIPWAKGGLGEENNLRLRCASHNLWHATQSYGQNKMVYYIKR